MESKRAKLQEEEKEDHISDLPDHIIHHILSLLPSTKDSVRTGILSKRWQNQWTRVPVLIFNSTTSGMSSESFLKFVDNTLILHDCSKINKFHLKYIHRDTKFPQLSSKIRFAITKSVEDLYLILEPEHKIPIFLFNNASLVRLVVGYCIFTPNGKVNWECLTRLVMVNCRLADDQVMDLILSGSPLLKTLYLRSCVGFKKLVIASKSLKQLYLEQFRSVFDIEISCPKLAKVFLLHCLNVRTAKLLNLPSLLCATIDFNHRENDCNETRMSLIKDILNQLRHVKELTIGSWFAENMSAIQVGGQFSPVFNIKRLTLKSHNMSVIVCLLRNSPVLKKLHIDVTLYDQDYQNFGENYWSDATVFKCLVSNLKTITITGFPKSDDKRKVMLNFVQFFLKNARVLEKIVVKLKDDGTDFPVKLSQELLSIPRCPQSAIIQFVCSK